VFPQNQYPNFTNFAYPSFPQEVTPPDSDADAGDMICVTYSRSWTAVLMSACNQLIQLSSWKGTDDEKKLAASRAVNLQWMLQHDIGCDMGCCYDVVEHRITSTGAIEIRVNGGDWIPDPTDPRITAPTMPPITMDETHTKCDAATNAATHIDDIISETSSQLGGAGSIIEIAIAIVAAIFALFIAPEALPALVPVILPLIAGLIFLGQAAWDAYFSSDVHSKILCALYCTIGDDGTFTDAQYAAFLSKLGTDLPASPAKDMFISLVSRIGTVGLNNYAAIGTSASANCEACNCETPCVGDWEIWSGSETYGTIVGFGDDFIDLELSFAPATVGEYFARLRRPDGAPCCCITSYELLSGSILNIAAYNRCGEACTDNAANHPLDGITGSGSFQVQCFQMGAVAASTIRVHFSGNDPCP